MRSNTLFSIVWRSMSVSRQLLLQLFIVLGLLTTHAGAVTKPTQTEGVTSLRTAVAAMKSLCDGCCQTASGAPCDPAQCKQEADTIVNAIIASWNSNYGKGSNTSVDNVGGYLCWDWAKKFADAASGTNSRCWTVKTGMAQKRNSRAVHYWTELYACNVVDECLVIVDDGWFIAKTLVHGPPFPDHPDWTRGSLPLPPAGRRLTPPKPKDSGLEDSGALLAILIVSLILGTLYIAQKRKTALL